MVDDSSNRSKSIRQNGSRRNLMGDDSKGRQRASSRRSLENMDESANSAGKLPAQRERRARVMTGNSDVRSRIRKEAALKREKELRAEEEAKLAKQKAKLAEQKLKTKGLLGEKLAQLDNMNGSSKNSGDGDTKTINSSRSERRRLMDMRESSHNPNPRTNATTQRRRRRQNDLNHSILVRNLNQMTTRQNDDVGLDDFNTEDDPEDESEWAQEVEGDDDDDIIMQDTSKTAAWQKRRARQQQSMM